MRRLPAAVFVLAILAAGIVVLAVPRALASGGGCWSDPASLITNADTDWGNDRDPQVTTDGLGNWLAVWRGMPTGANATDDDILVSRSTDTGVTWTAPAPLNPNAYTDLAWDSDPQVTTDGGGNWVAVWVSTENLGGIGTDHDILVARSTDNGATWTAPAPLNTNAATDSGWDDNPQVTTDGGDNWVAVWDSDENLGGIGTDHDILVARSTDNGTTWTAPAPLNTNAATDSLDDWVPQVATDALGNWLALWTSHDTLGGTIGVDGDILVARSTDNGATWTAPAALNTYAADDSAYDAAAEATTDGLGNWVALWYSNENLGGTIGSDFDVLGARSTDNGVTWTAPSPLNSNAGSDLGSDSEPQVTTDGLGNWLAIWSSADSLGDTVGTDNDILVARSTDNGVTWTAPSRLNSNAGSDSGDDADPQVTTDGRGNWLAVWQSDDDLGGTIGTDDDILVARFTAIGTAAAELATAVVGADYLWGGKGWDSNDRRFLEPQGIRDGYWYCTKDGCAEGAGLDCSGVSFWSFNKASGATSYQKRSAPYNPVHYEGADGQCRLNSTDIEDLGETDPSPGDLLCFDWGLDGDYDHVEMYVGEFLYPGGTIRGIEYAAGTYDVVRAYGDESVNLGIVPQRASDRTAVVGFKEFRRLTEPIVWGTTSTGSPVDIVVTDPDGLTITEDTWEVPGALYYTVYDINEDGQLDDMVTIPVKKLGDYLIQVVPEPDAAPTDTYSLVFEADDETVVLAQDRPISAIPSTGYTVESTETGIFQIYPPVGGIAELPDVADSSGRNYIALAGLAAAALVALTAGALYARRWRSG